MVGLSDARTPSTLRIRTSDWRKLLPWMAALIAALTAFGVFALPWLVRVPVAVVVSQSQALGFNNRVAVFALSIGAGLLGLLGIVWRSAFTETLGACPPGVLVEREKLARDRVDWR